VASVVDAVKAVVVADVARVDPRLPLLKDRKVLPLLNALNVEEKERELAEWDRLFGSELDQLLANAKEEEENA
jgi:hypothetical protein